MTDIALAALAFFAAGANALAAGVLLLIVPWHREVRWYVAFTLVQVAWLLLQGATIALGVPGGTHDLGLAYRLAGHFLPATFLAFGLVADRDASPARLAAVFIAWAALVPFVVGQSPWHIPGVEALGHVAGWGLGSWLVWRSRRKSNAARAADRRASIVRSGRARHTILRLVLALPAIVVGAMLFGVEHVFEWFLPPALVVVQLLILYGLLRHQLYEVEVRVGRTGDLAAAAAEQERLAVLGELSATVAHEVRNPLTGIRSLAQRLADDDVDDARRRRFAGVILGEIDRVERIVSDLLALARRRPVAAARLERIALASLFADLALLVAPRAERAGVTVEVDGAGIEVVAAREPLAQVLLNLLLNAIAASPDASRVALTAARSAAGVRLLVRDRGPGVPADMRERIFDAFHSGSDGAGLGLALVRRVSEAHHWTVAVGETPGGGAEFAVEVPGEGGGRREEGGASAAPIILPSRVGLPPPPSLLPPPSAR